MSNKGAGKTSRTNLGTRSIAGKRELVRLKKQQLTSFQSICNDALIPLAKGVNYLP